MAYRVGVTLYEADPWGPASVDGPLWYENVLLLLLFVCFCLTNISDADITVSKNALSTLSNK